MSMPTPVNALLLMLLLTAVAGCKPSPNATAVGETSTAGTTSAEPPTGATAMTTAQSSAAPTPTPVDPPMVRLPAGTYYQGSAGATGDDFAWQHLESVPAFDLDATEVTVEAYQDCLEAGACTYAPRSTDCNMERERDEYKRDPVNCVTWEEAVKFCAWRGAGLPTDGMWEYAAGGRRNEQYPWDPRLELRLDRRKTPFRPLFSAKYGSCREGDSVSEIKIPQRAKYGRDTTCPVGSLPHGDTLDGVKDLAGNVAEWTQTPFCEHHKKLCEEGCRTVKGGAFNGIGNAGRLYRMSIDEKTWKPYIGFRCARVVKADSKKGR